MRSQSLQRNEPAGRVNSHHRLRWQGTHGQLGLGDCNHQVVPVRVGGADVFESRILDAVAGPRHTAAIAADG